MCELNPNMTIGGMGEIKFPGPNGEPGSGDLVNVQYKPKKKKKKISIYKQKPADTYVFSLDEFSNKI